MKSSMLTVVVMVSCICALCVTERLYAVPGDVKVDCTIRSGSFVRSMVNRVKDSLKSMGGKNTRVRVNLKKVGPPSIPQTTLNISSEVSYRINPNSLGLSFSGVPSHLVYLTPCTIPLDMTIFTDAEFPTSTPGVSKRVQGTSYYKNLPFPGVMD